MQRILWKHQVSTAVKPHTKLCNFLIHPKTNPIWTTAGIVYEIPCKTCDKSYVGETGRLFGTRKKEHRDEATRKKLTNYTRSARKDRESLVFVSSVAEHAVLQNHIIDWEGSDSLAKDNTWSTRRIRESIWIKEEQTHKTSYSTKMTGLTNSAISMIS